MSNPVLLCRTLRQPTKTLTYSRRFIWYRHQHPTLTHQLNHHARRGPLLVVIGERRRCWKSSLAATTTNNDTTTREPDAPTKTKPISSSSSTTTNDSSSSSLWLQKSSSSSSSSNDLSPASLAQLACQSPTPLRLADMYKYGTDPSHRLRNAQFLYQELQIRCAQRAYDLLTLPHGLAQASSIQQVAGVYLGYLQRFSDDVRLPRNDVEEDEFTHFLASLVLDRTTIPMSIARGVQEWRSKQRQKEEGEPTDDIQQEMEDALYRFFTARVGLRFLCEHHVLSSQRVTHHALRKVTNMFGDDDNNNNSNSNSNTSTSNPGCIQTNCDIHYEVQRVVALVEAQTRAHYYGVCPEVQIIYKTAPQGIQRNFTHVPHHLHYIISELLKNACRATIMNAARNTKGITNDDLPPIRIVIVKGEEDVTIKVADKGGGIPRSVMQAIWQFAHSTTSLSMPYIKATPNESTKGAAAAADTTTTTTTTTPTSNSSSSNNTSTSSTSSFGTDWHVSQSRGFGLPLARIYARYFGGELTLRTLEGYGVDAYLHLPRLGDAGENLPPHVKASPGALDSLPKCVL